MSTNPRPPDAQRSEVAANAHFDNVHAYILSQWRNRQDIEHLVQEIFLRLQKGDYSEQDVHSPRGLLCCIADRVIADQLRNQARPSVASAPAPIQPGMESLRRAAQDEEPVGLQQYLRQLKEASRGLPPKQYVVWILFKSYRLSRKHIAKKLGLSQHTIKKYVTKANKHLKDELRRMGNRR